MQQQKTKTKVITLSYLQKPVNYSPFLNSKHFQYQPHDQGIQAEDFQAKVGRDSTRKGGQAILRSCCK